MTIRDLKNNVVVKTSLKPAVRTSGTTNGVSVDLRGYDAAMIAVTIGSYTDGEHSFVMQHSVDNVTFTNVDEASLDGTFAVVTSADHVMIAGYLGCQRYVRVVSTVVGATSGAVSCAHVIAGYPHQAPVL